jgi:hypothetical protein
LIARRVSAADVLRGENRLMGEWVHNLITRTPSTIAGHSAARSSERTSSMSSFTLPPWMRAMSS